MYNRKQIKPIIQEAAEEAVKSLKYYNTVVSSIQPETTKKAPFALITITESEVNSYDTPATIRMEYMIAINALLKNDKTRRPNDVKSDALADLRQAFAEHPVIGKFGPKRVAFLGEFTTVDHNEDEDIGDDLLEVALIYKFYVTVLDRVC